MPVIYTTQYKNLLAFTEFTHANFVKKSGPVYDVEFMGDKFYQFLSGYWYEMTSGATGFRYPNISNKLTQTNEYGMARNHTTSRLFLHASNDTNGGVIYSSDDAGATWQSRISGGGPWRSIATNHNNVVITTALWTSNGSWVAATRRSIDDGNTWSDITAQASGASRIEYIKRLNMWVMSSYTSTHPSVKYSTNNGNTWSAITMTDGKGSFGKVIDTGTLLISQTGTQTVENYYPIRTSTDGVTWTPIYARGTPPGVSFADIAYGNGVLVGVLANKNNFYYSKDNGTTWTMGTFPNNAVISNVEYGNNQFLFGTNTVAEYHYYMMP